MNTLSLRAFVNNIEARGIRGAYDLGIRPEHINPTDERTVTVGVREAWREVCDTIEFSEPDHIYSRLDEALGRAYDHF